MLKLLQRDYLLITSAVFIVAISGVLVSAGRATLPVVVAAGFVVFVILLCYRHLMALVRATAEDHEQRAMTHYRQLESVAWLSSILKVKQPLPAMRGMAISPDFASLLAETLYSRKPHVVVELGCGTSTLVSSYILDQLGGGQVISIDHDEKFAGICCRQLEQHALHRARIFHCPLVIQEVNGSKFEFYDLSKAHLPENIDVLAVDGPPRWIGQFARYPAMPLLLPFLSPSAVILVDDAGRPDEKTMVKRWLKEIPGFEERYLPTEKGTAILYRHPKA